MNAKPWKCGCERGYRDVITGTLKAYAAGSDGVALAIAMDPCGEAFLGCDKDEAWAKAHIGSHLNITITQFPNQGSRVVDIGLLIGRASELAHKAAWVGMVMWAHPVKVGEGRWELHLTSKSIPKGHPILEELKGQTVLPIREHELEVMYDKMQKLKRDHERLEG